MQTMRRVALPDRVSAGEAADAGPLVVGFLALQFFLGYEWVMSGLSKALASDFARGLGATLSDMTKDQGGWYKSFIDNAVIPNGQLFGYLVMVGELSLGIVLIVTAGIWLARWQRMAFGQRSLLLAVVALAAAVGAFMSLNFHLAMGATPPWQISPDPNDQGVDLDSLMVVMQLVLAAVSFRYLVSIRRAYREETEGILRRVGVQPARTSK